MSNQVDWEKYQWKDTDSLEEKQRKASEVMSALDADIKKMEPLPWESGIQSEDLPVFKDSRIHLYKGSEIDDRYDEIKTLYGDGMTTGFEAVDELFTFLPEHLYLLSAETHVGKTTFALNMCGKASTLGHSVLFASLEQGIFIAPRIKTILGGPIPETFSLLDTTQLVNIDELAGFIKTMEIKPALLCIDHIHFIKKKGNNPNIDIEEMVVDMKNMAKDLRIPILLIAHLRKLSDTKPPTPNDIKDSVALSQVPDVTMILHREKRDPEDENNNNDLLKPRGKLYVYKNRVTGKTGTLNFSLLPTGEFVFDFG